MDPVISLQNCDQHISDGFLSEARFCLADYRAWRAKGGFEPTMTIAAMQGDKFADECERRLVDAERQVAHDREIANSTSLPLLSAWLVENTGSHDIYDSEALAAQFKADIGQEADWPTYTESQMVAQIKARGNGGSLAIGAAKRLANGCDIAEHLAARHARWKPWQRGLGFRWRSAIDALKKAGY